MDGNDLKDQLLVTYINAHKC